MNISTQEKIWKILWDEKYCYMGDEVMFWTEKWSVMIRYLLRDNISTDGKTIVHKIITEEQILKYLKANKNKIIKNKDRRI